MPSPKLERVKAKHRQVADLLDRMAEYIARQTSSGEEFIIPKLAAAALQINEGEAFVLLRMMADEHLVKQIYNIYCKELRTYLGSVNSLSALDEVPYCDDCDAQHPAHELTVEIAFRPEASLGTSNLAA
jgi:hypothetical protein